MAKYPCKFCSSSDAAAEVPNTDGIWKCFSCGRSWKEGTKTVVQNEFKNEMLVDTTEITNTIRGISPAIFKQYSYFKGPEGEHVANIYDKMGRVIAQKSRYENKTFKWRGNTKGIVPFGMSQWRMGGKRITITEGEIDAMSVAEALGGKYPVISLNNGAQGAKNELKPHIEFLNSFEEIVLWFDTDTPGKKAVAEVSGLFPPGKVLIVDSAPFKDANEVLRAKGKAGVLHYYYEARKFTPAGIVNANEGGFEALLEDSNSDEVFTTPFNNLTIAKGAITTFVSGSGMGKSTIIRELGYHLLIEHNLTIGHVALEENNSVSKRAYLGIDLNTPIIGKRKWNIFKSNPENIQKIKASYDKVIAPGKLYLYNHFGSLDSESLLSKLRYLIIGAGCDIIILDHISIVVSGLEDMGDNERRVIDVLMTKLRSLVEETGVGMILISHLKRLSSDKGHENGAEINLSHLRGSGSIAQLSDKVLALEGNQQSEEDKHKRIIRCLKDREEGEKVGILGHAIYDADIGRLLPIDIDVEFEEETEEF
ncbi:MAG: toprim domain-containing protein [Campylobacterales bacterium]|nr:toprim domain-containing protein [Campylobacterales bacterium]